MASYHRRNSLYTRNSGSRDLYQQPYAQEGGNPSLHSPGEVDLRAELDDLFFGYSNGIRHGYLVLIRRMRRDSNGVAEACTCLGELTREADPDCSYCLGEGYLFDESWLWTYSMYGASDTGLVSKITYMPPGAVRVDYKIFFFRYDSDIQYGDKIVEVKLDEDGNLVVPYVRVAIYKPQTINKYRSDNSRIEYIAAYCREDDALRLDNL